MGIFRIIHKENRNKLRINGNILYHCYERKPRHADIRHFEHKRTDNISKLGFSIFTWGSLLNFSLLFWNRKKSFMDVAVISWLKLIDLLKNLSFINNTLINQVFLYPPYQLATSNNGLWCEECMSFFKIICNHRVQNIICNMVSASYEKKKKWKVIIATVNRMKIFETDLSIDLYYLQRIYQQHEHVY